MLTVSDVQALIVITLGDAFVLNRRVRQQTIAMRRSGVIPGTVVMSCRAKTSYSLTTFFISRMSVSCSAMVSRS